jgi:hypothetical protein
MQPLALGAEALAFGCPRKWGRKRRHFHVLLIFGNIIRHERGTNSAGRDEADVPAESTCASAGHARAKSGHRSGGSAKGANASERAKSGPHLARGAVL